MAKFKKRHRNHSPHRHVWTCKAPAVGGPPALCGKPLKAEDGSVDRSHVMYCCNACKQRAFYYRIKMKKQMVYQAWIKKKREEDRRKKLKNWDREKKTWGKEEEHE